MMTASMFHNGPYGYEAHLQRLAEEVRWSEQNLRDSQATDNAERTRAWAARYDRARAAYERAMRER